jgi:hypothetical protein
VDVTTADGPVAVQFRATDGIAGVGEPVSVWTQPARRISGTRHDGVWRRTILIDGCVFSGGQEQFEVVVFDRVGHRAAARTTITVVNNNRDLTPPYLSAVEPASAGPTESVSFVFNEDVTGVSDASAPVRSTEAGMGFSTGVPPPAQPGAWACTSANGVPVDCATGSLRRATWTPHVALTVGQSYGVDFNPEHILDVLDLAGNPIDPLLRHEDEFAPTWTVHG